MLLLPLPPPQSRAKVHVDGLSPRIVEGGLGSRGRAGLVALALIALTLVAMATGTAAAIIASVALAVIAATIAPLPLT
jgi:hypothetical protein